VLSQIFKTVVFSKLEKANGEIVPKMAMRLSKIVWKCLQVMTMALFPPYLRILASNNLGDA
jgi:hypothetical protein